MWYNIYSRKPANSINQKGEDVMKMSITISDMNRKANRAGGRKAAMPSPKRFTDRKKQASKLACRSRIAY